MRTLSKVEFVALAAVATGLVGCGGENTSPPHKEVATEPGVVHEETHEVVASYEKGEDGWKIVVVDGTPPDEDLINLAHRLRSEHPDTRFHIFNHSAKVQEYVNWTTNPKFQGQNDSKSLILRWKGGR